MGTYLLITNGELALSLLVLVGESFELLDGLRLQDLNAKFDVALRVFMARLESVLAQCMVQNMEQLLVRRHGCHLGEQRESRSVPCPSPLHCLRKSVRSLR